MQFCIIYLNCMVPRKKIMFVCWGRKWCLNLWFHQSLQKPGKTRSENTTYISYIKHRLILQLHAKHFLYKGGDSPALYISSIPFRFVYRTADISVLSCSSVSAKIYISCSVDLCEWQSMFLIFNQSRFSVVLECMPYNWAEWLYTSHRYSLGHEHGSFDVHSSLVQLVSLARYFQCTLFTSTACVRSTVLSVYTPLNYSLCHEHGSFGVHSSQVQLASWGRFFGCTLLTGTACVKITVLSVYGPHR